MSSFSRLIKSAKGSFSSSSSKRRSSDSSSSSGGSAKSVRFAKSSGSVHYTHSSLEYDRTYVPEEITSTPDEEGLFVFDEEVIRNTKVNQKQGHYSIAALVAYRSTI